MNTAYVYILTNKHKTVLYVGMTTDLRTRMWEHKKKVNKQSFTAQYNVDQLVYYEAMPTVIEALNREKYLKGKLPAFKVRVIDAMNPLWEDLTQSLS